MKKYFVIGCLVLMVVAQWAVPVSMITEQENILSNGKIFKFRTRPIDPSDPFRGSYLTLRFVASTFKIDSSITYKGHEFVFVSLTKDSLDFASVRDISVTRPNSEDYLVAKVGSEYVFWDKENQKDSNMKIVEIDFPFERFYLEESKAKKAERQYNDVNSDSTQVAYAIIKIMEGKGAIEDVILNGESVRKIQQRANEAHKSEK